MYSAFLDKTKDAISALVKHIGTSERFRTALLDGRLKCKAPEACFESSLGSTEEAPDRTQWRVIDHCAAVTRIYAIYEQFVHEMVREHLSLLQSRLSFSELPEEIQSSYRLGIAKILEKKDGPRFSDLNLGNLIGSYNSALANQQYSLEPRAMIMQEQNLRFPELNRLMAACGVDGVASWLERHSTIRSFFSTEGRVKASAENQMSELIKYRNDAAHGSISVDDLLHVNVLIEFCEFISAVCEALAERVQLAGLCTLKANGHVSERGILNEVLREGMVAIGPMVGNFKVGATVYLCGSNYCLERNVVSIQLNDVSHNEINLDVETELGIMFDLPCRRNASVLSIVNSASDVENAEFQTVDVGSA